MADKPYKPTRKKLRDARKRGEIPKSREVTSFGLYLALLGFLWFGAAFIGQHVINVMERAITAPATIRTSFSTAWLAAAQGMLVDAFWIIGPLVLVGVVFAVLIGGLQTRGLFSLQPLVPKFERLNPGRGLANLFKLERLLDLVRMLIKTALLTGVLITCVGLSLGTLVKLVYAPAADILKVSGQIIFTLMAWAAVIYALGAAMEYALKYYEFMKQHRMSLDELRREGKDLEGDPYLKAQRRETGREIVYSDKPGRLPPPPPGSCKR